MFRNRNILMCFAICSVICYHLCLRGIPIGRLNIGYMGVDVFMLLSGYGIAKSLIQNPIKEFYIHRIRRIIPLWGIMISVAYVVNLLSGEVKSINVFFLNITSLSFYYNPDLLPEWYLATIILFYAVSPLFKILLEKFGWGLLVCISVLVVMKSELIGFEMWQYANAISRFPLYLLGMFCGIKNLHNLSYKITIPLFLLGIVFFFRNQHYLFSVCVALFSIQVANGVIDRWSFFKSKFFKWIGSHTLEIYVANTIAAVICGCFFSPEMDVLTKVLIDITITIVLSLLLWNISLNLRVLR